MGSDADEIAYEESVRERMWNNYAVPGAFVFFFALWLLYRKTVRAVRRGYWRARFGAAPQSQKPWTIGRQVLAEDDERRGL